jgi:DNA invertase Pin-like site-specific DNA recombinase
MSQRVDGYEDGVGPDGGPGDRKQVRALAALRWGSKRIAKEVGISRNSVRRYLREGDAAQTQVRPRLKQSASVSG